MNDEWTPASWLYYFRSTVPRDWTQPAITWAYFLILPILGTLSIISQFTRRHAHTPIFTLVWQKIVITAFKLLISAGTSTDTPISSRVVPGKQRRGFTDKFTHPVTPMIVCMGPCSSCWRCLLFTLLLSYNTAYSSTGSSVQGSNQCAPKKFFYEKTKTTWLCLLP